MYVLSVGIRKAQRTAAARGLEVVPESLRERLKHGHVLGEARAGARTEELITILRKISEIEYQYLVSRVIRLAIISTVLPVGILERLGFLASATTLQQRCEVARCCGAMEEEEEERG